MDERERKESDDTMPLLSLSDVREAQAQFERAFRPRLGVLIVVFIVAVLGLGEPTHRNLWWGLGYIPVFVLMGWLPIRWTTSLCKKFGLVCPYCGMSLAQLKMDKKEIPSENYHYCPRCKREIVDLPAKPDSATDQSKSVG